MDQGLHREGADWMATALMFDPDHLKTHRSLARYYAEVVHDPQLAEKHRARVRELDPESSAGGESEGTPQTPVPNKADNPQAEPAPTPSS